MIVNGSSNRCVSWWTQHLESEVNEEFRIVESHGLRGSDINGMLQEMMDLAQGTKCQNPFYQINFSPAPGERLTLEQWDTVRQVAERQHGFEGQPYFMVMHTKHGEEHPHYVYFRVNLETGKTISDSHDARKNHAIAREVERQLGLQKVIGPYDRQPGTPRPERAPERWEMLRGMETGIDPRDVAAEVTALFRQSDNGQAFKAALEAHGYELVTGKRGLLTLDSAGKEHSLARRCGITAKELDAFMQDVDRAAVPTVEQAKAAYQERKIAGLEADGATVAQEIAWEEKLAQAAIEKEKAQRQFAEPQPEKETRAAAGEELTGPAQHIRQARQHSDNPQAFVAALAEHDIGLAQATRADAVQSQLDSAEATIAGYWKPTFREGEIVAVTDQGQVWKLTPRTTGDKDPRDIQNFLAGLDAPLPSIQEAQHRKQRDRDLEELKPRGRWISGPQRGGMVEQQAWAMNRAKAADEYRRSEQERRDREAASKKTGEVDPQRYLTDPDYRRQVKAEQNFKTPEERKADRENDLRALLEQQDRQI